MTPNSPAMPTGSPTSDFAAQRDVDATFEQNAAAYDAWRVAHAAELADIVEWAERRAQQLESEN